MSKLDQKIDTGQISIFDLIRQSESLCHPKICNRMSIDGAIRAIISDSIKQCPLSRYEVAAKMSDILGAEITKAQLDSWSAESKENHRFPLIYISAFCQITGCRELARYMAKLCGGHFIEGEDALTLELGKVYEQKRELSKREQRIKNYLESLRGGKRRA